MRRSKILFILFFFLLFSEKKILPATNIDIKGYFDVFNSISVKKDIGLQSLRADLKTDLTLKSEKYLFNFSAFTTWNPFLKSSIEVILSEAYLSVPVSSSFELKAGKQIISWGSSDQFSPADLVSPYDLREFIAWDKDESRIGLNSVSGTYFANELRLDLIWSPRSSPSILPEADSSWSILNHPKESVTASLLDSEGVTSRSSGNSFFGKFSFFLKGFDFSFIGFSYFNYVPLDISNDVAGALPEYEKFRGLGFYFSKPWDFIVFRGEFILYKNRLVNNRKQEGNMLKKDRSEVLIGADIFLRNELGITIQLLINSFPGQYIMAIPYDKSTAITTSVSGKIYGDTLRFRTFFCYLLKGKGSYGRIVLNFPLDDSFSISGGSDFFSGPGSFYGRYLKNSQIWLKFKYIF